MVSKFERIQMRVSAWIEELVFLEKGFQYVAMADLEFFKLILTYLHPPSECWD